MNEQDRYGAHLGARVVGPLTHFATWTAAKACALCLYDEQGNVRARHALEPAGDGLFQLALPNAGHGTLYKFELDGLALPDPYARFLPQGVHGPAMVVESRYAFRFESKPRPLGEHVIYELHVGSFTEAGTYRGACERLPDLAKLGITCIELMPLAAFAGERGWGYDGVALFAPYAPYGTPDELRALIDEAHDLGLSVLLDVVYNHFGPAGSYLSSYHPEYFSSEVKNAWGESPNYAHPAMRAFTIANALYWLEEFRFDGLRLDAVHAIIDRSEKHVLRELSERVHAFDPRRILIAEDDRNDPAIIRDDGLDGMWADDFHHQLRVTLTGERDGYYAAYEPGVQGLAQVIERGWLYEGQVYPSSGKQRGKPFGDLPRPSLIYCIQNHDQVGNRALGDRLSHGASLDAFCMASALLLFLPMTPLLFMGQEWAASSPFMFFSDHEAELGEAVSRGRREEFKHFEAFSHPEARDRIPDPQADSTFARSRLHWEERATGDHARVLALYTELLTLRRTDEVLRDGAMGTLKADVVAGLLRVTRSLEGQERVLLANFGDRPVGLDAVDFQPDSTRLLVTGQVLENDLLAPRSVIVLASSPIGLSS
ncbi:MAG: malto-oligosyltrehalose trehalohydrolase [Myxococcaceae bacterium]|nr:malto-oligosyltrehalose trehalohydrolase [Myxococcaceae bacterium]